MAVLLTTFRKLTVCVTMPRANYNDNYLKRHRNPCAGCSSRETGDHARVLPADAELADCGLQSKEQPQSGFIVFRSRSGACSRNAAGKESHLRLPWQHQPRSQVQTRYGGKEAPQSRGARVKVRD